MITNEQLLPEVIRSKAAGVVSPELAAMFVELVNRVVYKPHYKHLTYKEDMVSEALMNLCKNGLKFKPEVSSNPFAYFHTIIVSSMYYVMAREKKARLA